MKVAAGILKATLLNCSNCLELFCPESDLDEGGHGIIISLTLLYGDCSLMHALLNLKPAH